ncbi:serine hydrolase domain-containing protein [Carboxylicivirga sp. N1Y90]|uniref:serine hydrolase domain-containing protein n=1 Tax=Carboxylicivirga fragile TaxID=3417571 RepID=UPI003D34A732|nr:serine hydrolase [Marinilabiliaceae bacterium N1Y90]
MAAKKRFRFTFIIVLFIGIWFLLPHHMRMAFTYWFPGIADYEIFENREVKTSDNTFTWPSANNYNQASFDKQWRDTLEHYQTIAYLVIKNDSIVYEEYWDGYGPDSYSNSFSAAKSIVALLIGAAIEDGYIQSVDQKASDFLPHLEKYNGKELTIRHLLNMSSGSSWDESYSSPLSMTTKAYYGDRLDNLVNELKIVEIPGEIFEYKSGDTQILAHILREATGQNLSHYASQKLWKPLGARQPALWSLDTKNGYEKAYCCFNSNARDFALLGALINHKGFWRGQQIISEQYLQYATSPASHLVNLQMENVDYYGFQYWLLKHKDLNVTYARGILGQYIISIPEKDLIIVRLGHKRSNTKMNHHPSDVYAYIQMALDITN